MTERGRGHCHRPPGIKKRAQGPPLRKSLPPGARAEQGSTRAGKLLLLRLLGLLRLLRLLRFLSHSILSGFNGWKRDTRGMLGGGPASQHPRMLIQQIRGPLPRAVTPPSSRYPQLKCIFDAISRKFPSAMPATHAPRAVWRRAMSAWSSILAPWDAASSGLTAPQRDGAVWINPEQAARFFMISKPQQRLPPRGESPLSGAAATYPQ
jgi:hypothetical protein